jgi:CYTH domain-containing protein
MLFEMAHEVERKFVADQVPASLILEDAHPVRQGYLAIDGAIEVRVRLLATSAVLTVKGGAGLSRTEVELPLTPADAEALWAHTEGRRIEKRRFRVDVDGIVAEIDRYGGRLEGLCTIEVEFGDEAEAEAFVPPRWFGVEVTGDPRWSNASLALHGLPLGQ